MQSLPGIEPSLTEQLDHIRSQLRECYRVRAHYQEVVDELLDQQQAVIAKQNESRGSSGSLV